MTTPKDGSNGLIIRISV